MLLAGNVSSSKNNRCLSNINQLAAIAPCIYYSFVELCEKAAS